MSTFAKTTFDTTVYAASRPTYPKALFQFIFNYHRDGPSALPTHSKPTLAAASQLSRASPRWNVAVDLGCGTGQATAELLPFKRVIGADPSKGMVEQATKYVQEKFGGNSLDGNASPSQFEFIQSPAEELGFLENDSVDLVIAAQAAHWFDWAKLWPEVGRVLRPNGTLAFWVYSEFRLPRYPTLTPLITDYLQGTSLDESLGPYWQRPGRTILENHLLDVPDPASIKGAEGLFVGDCTDRVYFTGSHHPSLPSESTLPVILRSKTTWNGLLGYFRTFSSLHTYLERHPDDAKREGGNIAERFWRGLMEGAAKVEARAGEKKTEIGEGGVVVKGEDEVMVEWPVALVLAKRK